MGEEEFEEKTKMFACDKCNYFIERVSDIVTDKVSSAIGKLIERLETKIECLEKQTDNHLGDGHSVDEEQLSCHSPKINNSRESEVPTSNLHSDTVSAIIENTESPSVNNNKPPTSTNQQEQQRKERNDNVTGKVFLCSIEKNLSKSDIQFILEDAGIDMKDIEILEAEGNFKNKRYVEIKSNKQICLFKFKISFGQCNLNKTWFVRNSPPKSPIAQEAQKFSNNKQQPLQKFAHKNQQPAHHVNRNNNIQKGFQQYTRPFTNYKSNQKFSNSFNSPSYSSVTQKSVYEQQNSAPTREPRSMNANYIRKEDFQSFLEEVLQRMLVR